MSSNADFSGTYAVPVSALQYRDIAGHALAGPGALPEPEPRAPASGRRAEVELTEEEFAARMRQERSEAASQAEQKVRQEYEQKLLAARTAISTALAKFSEERDGYFARVESEVVQLSLSIAAKILHREAQVDPMLVATLVRIAVERMREGSSVTVRVSPGRAPGWKEYLAAQPGLARIAVETDPQLSDLDCILETELGSANFGLDSQLKEVEQGFFDLLALRPGAR